MLLDMIYREDGYNMGLLIIFSTHYFFLYCIGLKHL